ncbi:MAG: hypothetical protein U1C74_31980 [Phenylobacterium sp.]|uniref:hypothetical protein n=1 Tax=Brevundimonas sp. TaxID=1871086 RepID=UPI002737AAC8|nr:hypothetical protein [Brevundimonas sp.]MDP3803476.1 hypothetical protein [Brevundimonas sp.]MDZ4376023.1 hypothetical protein [Phenylobacterium sp.]
MLNRADFGDHASYAQAMHAGGYDIHDRWGRQRYAVGDDDLGRALLASVPAPEQRPTPVSEYLTAKEFWKRYQSVAAANFTGVVLGWMLTVSWGSVGLSGGAAWKAHQAFMELMRKWHQERGLPNAWVWVRENSSTLGDHSHILVSLERWHEADFISWANRAVATITGSAPMAKSKDQPIQTVHLSRGHVRRHADIDAQWRLFQYVCKGLNPDEATPIWDHPKGNILAAHLINRPCRRQGWVTGLRSGSARALNSKRISELAAHPDWQADMTKDGVPFYDDRYLAAGRLEKDLAALKIWP